MSDDNQKAEMCKFCDHFITENIIEAPSKVLPDGLTLAVLQEDGTPQTDGEQPVVYCRYLHLEDGDQEFDHNATPSGDLRPLEQWQAARPDLFRMYADGSIGPNSIYHSQRGKIDAGLASARVASSMELVLECLEERKLTLLAVCNCGPNGFVIRAAAGQGNFEVWGWTLSPEQAKNRGLYDGTTKLTGAGAEAEYQRRVKQWS
jgi:hypothetical protein